LVTYQACSQES